MKLPRNLRDQDPLRVGTLNGILRAVAVAKFIPVESIVETLR